MNQDLEYELKQALRRKEPSRDLMPRRSGSRWRFAVAAGIAIAIAGPGGLWQYREHQRHRAKDQLVFALHLTASKLGAAQQKLRTVK
jgi:hypothetical protein